MKTIPPSLQLLCLRIQRVLETGKPWENKNLHYPARDVIDAVLSIDGMSKKNCGDDEDRSGTADGFDTNGWQWDWWQKFTYAGNGKTYVLSGRGYYGGHSFALDDEEDADE